MITAKYHKNIKQRRQWKLLTKIIHYLIFGNKIYTEEYYTVLQYDVMYQRKNKTHK